MQHYQRIRDLREDCDLTQQQLCEKLGMHKTTYTNYEQGKHSVPLDFAVTLAEFYGVSLDYLAGRTNFKQGMSKPTLTDDEVKLIADYRSLSEREKGRHEQFIQQLISSHK